VIRVGPTGWAYKDWNGIVYPKPKPRGFDELAYLARYFNAIEINSSYYGAPKPTTAKKWLESISANSTFHFTAKLFHSFTHERKPELSDEKEFKDGIAPIMEAGRLGALLLQFPWSFRNTPENREYVTGLRRRFADYPLVLEARHGSWAEADILDFLTELDMGLCNIDQQSIKPGSHATSSIGYIRLHGRNYRSWFSEKANVRERYDYLYSVDELEPWLDRVKAIAGRTKHTYVVTNNHNIGKAPVNALQIMSLVKGVPIEAPPRFVQHYPELCKFAHGAEKEPRTFF
jgi:uncharacterized protein YecE (DUF72 family)